jgi:hypothetical protein
MTTEALSALEAEIDATRTEVSRFGEVSPAGDLVTVVAPAGARRVAVTAMA